MRRPLPALTTRLQLAPQHGRFYRALSHGDRHMKNLVHIVFLL